MLSQSLSRWCVVCIVSLLVLGGCAAAYTPSPLTMSHPAHLEATAAPEPPPSTTLAYGSSDLPSPQPAYGMAQSSMQHGMQHGAQHGMHGAQPSAQEAQHTVVGEGKVVAVVPSSGQIVVDHQEIKGFMDAMTMGYRIDPPSLLEGVQAGDAIRFTIDTQNKAIIKIEKMQE